MKKFLLAVITIAFAITGQAQNRWNIYAGGSISHLCEKPWISSDKSYSWGGVPSSEAVMKSTSTLIGV